MAADPITAIADFGSALITRLFPDPTERVKAQATLDQMRTQGDLAQLAGSIQIIIAEAQSGSWLTRSWRPITMLVFLWLIVSYWYGWHAANLSDALVDQLFQIIKIGLGGYTVGRSLEKVAPIIAGRK